VLRWGDRITEYGAGERIWWWNVLVSDRAPRRRGPYAKTAGRRREIVDAAMRLFAARGYRATSMREVAAASGIGLSTLTHHFPDKEALLIEALRRRDEMGTSLLPEGADRFAEYIVSQARINDDLRGLIEVYTVLSAEATTVDHPGRDYFIERFAGLERDYAEHLGELAAAGRLREGVDPRIAATSLVALWDGLQLQWLLRPDDVDVAAHLRAFLDLVTLPAEPSGGADATASADRSAGDPALG
jgi:AcrR family transcriptional regulator